MGAVQVDASAVVETVGQVLLVGGLVTLAVATAVGLALWYVVRRVRRSRRLRRGLDRSRLTVRSVAADDAGRRLARLHLELHRSLDATQRSIGAATSSHRPVGNMPSIAANLVRAGEQLEEELRLAELEPDKALRETWAAWLEGQVAEHARLSTDLRRSLLTTGVGPGVNHLDRASQHLAVEIEALSAWDPAYRKHPHSA
ncbi:hypothetical protein V5H98_00655 [Georgenia sp. M64]|uniref:hypothetical protein n=1 Tax=Georgenia sp. M64 TaxID=3120520 RepID=UPI0030E3DA92